MMTKSVSEAGDCGKSEDPSTCGLICIGEVIYCRDGPPDLNPISFEEPNGSIFDLVPAPELRLVR